MLDDNTPSIGDAMKALLARTDEDLDTTFESWDEVAELLMTIGSRTGGDSFDELVATTEVDELKGSGAHRELIRTWKVYPQIFDGSSAEDGLATETPYSCDLSVLTFIPGGLFMDAAEVSRQEERSAQKSQIFGAEDIEGPSSPRFRAVSHTFGEWTLRVGNKRDLSPSQAISISLPVHARYPVVLNSRNSAFRAGPPRNVVRLIGGVVLANCTGEGGHRWIRAVKESNGLMHVQAHEWIIPSIHTEWGVFVRVVTLTLTSLGTFILFNEGLRATVLMQ